MNAIYLETDVGSATFPRSDGLFDELTAGQMYKLHGDPISSLSADAPASEIRNPVLGFASERTTSRSSVAIASTPARAPSWTYTSTPAPETYGHLQYRIRLSRRALRGPRLGRLFRAAESRGSRPADTLRKM